MGKSALINCFSQTKEDKKVTIGIDLQTVYLSIQSQQTIKVKVWDTAGQEQFTSLTHNFIKSLDAAILVYDLTCDESYQNTTQWRQ